MATSEPFTFISGEHHPRLTDAFEEAFSGKILGLSVQLLQALRRQNPDLIVTFTLTYNCPLLKFAAAGYATAELDTETEDVFRVRGYIPPTHRGGLGHIGEGIEFAKYRYHWKDEDFIVYDIDPLQFVLKEPRDGETPQSSSVITDALIMAVGSWITREIPAIYVYDNYWTRSVGLYEEVMKTSWDDVILDKRMKEELPDITSKFFDSKDVYDEFGVPWKRGLIFYGPAGNGKTISIKALMHTLYDRKPQIPCLYVKNAPYTWSIRNVFTMARAMSPCLLVLEDIETIVTSYTRSYFFNEVDGLENNDGILMLASTNYLDRLDPGLSKRPSRFDRKYLFPLPWIDERIAYCEYWRQKLDHKKSIDFPKLLCAPIAKIMEGFTFAYMKEAFVATLLALARGHTSIVKKDDPHDGDSDSGSDTDGDDDDLDQYELWRVMVEQVKILREDMGGRQSASQAVPDASTAEADNGIGESIPLMSAVGALDGLALDQNPDTDSGEQRALARMQRFNPVGDKAGACRPDGGLNLGGLDALPDLTRFGGQSLGVNLAGNSRTLTAIGGFGVVNRDQHQPARGYLRTGREREQWFGTHGVGAGNVSDAFPVRLVGDRAEPSDRAPSGRKS